VYVIDTATNTVGGTTIPIGVYPGGIAVNPDGSLAYVANGGTLAGGQTVSAISV
jgi:DNA-binding beta-propeller fold protein YncE